MTTGQRDPLGVASRLAVLANIQNAMRGSSLHCVVVRVEASWTCVVSTSLINGSFSGGAVVVTLNNGKRALACLAGSPHRADGGYRVVCTLMAEELVCHSTINARLIDDCATTKERNSAPQFTFAACFQEHEKARYLVLEKCPPEVMSCLFQSVELEVEGSSGTSPPAPLIGPVATAEGSSSLTIGQQEIEGEEQLPCTSRTVVVPLGSLDSRLCPVRCASYYTNRFLRDRRSENGCVLPQPQRRNTSALHAQIMREASSGRCYGSLSAVGK